MASTLVPTRAQQDPDPQTLIWSSDVVILLASISVACTVLAMTLTAVFRDRASFVFSQPSFLGVLLLGILLLQASMFFLAGSLRDAQIYSGSSASCRVYLWLFWVGSSVALSAQCARLYRALLVFRERSLRRPKLNTTKFFLSLGALAMIPMGLMLIRMLIDPVQIDQGVCLPLEVASNPNSIVLGLMVRLSVWGLLAVCAWFTRILQKLGATVDDAKTQTRLFFWIFLADATITGMQSAGLPSDHVAILLSGAIAYGTITALHAVFSLKLARIGLNGKEMLLTLRREKEARELNAMAIKIRPAIYWPQNSCCRRILRKEPLMFNEIGNPQAEMQVSSRAPRVSIQGTANDGEDEDFGNDPFMSDVILASMTSRPVSRVSIRLNSSAVASSSAAQANLGNNPHASLQGHLSPILDSGPAVGFTSTSPLPGLSSAQQGQRQPAQQQSPQDATNRNSFPLSPRLSSGANDVILASIN